MKKVAILFTSVFLFLSFLLACLFGLMSANMTQSALAAETDITKLSALEQEKVNEQIKQEWGTPSKIRRLSQDLLKEENGLPTSESEVWYYLNGNVELNYELTISPGQDRRQHVRILMNGYSISGKFLINAISSRAKLSIFDKIPNFASNAIGNVYQYNPAPEKYYRYDSTTGVYSLFSATPPEKCVDVTDMPTFTADTYVRVVGSSFVGSKTSTDIDVIQSGEISLISESRSTVAVYGINFIGLRTSNLLLTEVGNLNLVSCTLLGNVTGNALIGVFGGTTNLIGNTVYGNRTSGSDFGVRASNHAENYSAWDIYMKTAITQYYKNNVGAIYEALYSKKAIWIKGVDFNRVLRNFDLNEFQDVLNCNGMSGTIELVYGLNVTYSKISPNLSFIVHGGDKQEAPIRGYNGLKIEKTAVISSLTTAFEQTSGDDSKLIIPSFTIEGRVEKGLSTPGEVALYGYATIAYGQSVKTLKNYGELKMYGKASDVENYGTVSLYETNLVVNGGTIDNPMQEIIPQGAVIYDLKNYGTATFNGCSQIDNDVYNYSNGVVILNDKSLVYHEAHNEGTITLNNSSYVAGLKNNANGKAVIASEVGYLEFNSGNITISSSNVIFRYIGALKIPAGASFTIDDGVVLVVNKQIYNSTSGVNGQFVLESIENNGALNIAGSFMDITNFTNKATLNILPTGRVIVYKDQTIDAVIHNDGFLNLADTPKATVRTDSTRALGQLQGTGLLNIEQNVEYTVYSQETFTNRINNDGLLIIDGTVEDITGSGETNILQAGSAKIVAGKEISGNITTAGHLTVDGTVNTVTSAETGNLYVSRTGFIKSLNTNGQSILDEHATVNELFVNNGYTKILDLSVVENVVVYNGTLEISGAAKVSRITKPNETGTIIDHRGAFKTTVVLIAIIVGVITLALVALIMVMLISSKRRKNSKAEIQTADFTRLLAIKLAKATKYVQKDKLLQDRNQNNIVIKKTDVKS